jgi:hypothetical protein
VIARNVQVLRAFLGIDPSVLMANRVDSIDDDGILVAPWSVACGVGRGAAPLLADRVLNEIERCEAQARHDAIQGRYFTGRDRSEHQDPPAPPLPSTPPASSKSLFGRWRPQRPPVPDSRPSEDLEANAGPGLSATIFFRMTFADGELTLWRQDPDFHQRFVATVTADRIDGRWDASEDAGA